MQQNARADAGSPTYEISLWHLLAFVLRSRRVITWSVIVVTVLAFVATMASDRVFASPFSFRPPSVGGTDGQIASLAAQFGVNIGRGQSGESPAFFSALLKSRSILERVAARQFPGADTTLVPLHVAAGLEVVDTNPLLIRDQTVLWLLEAVDVSVNTETGIVQVSVRAPTARLAHALAMAHVEELHRFNLEFRRAQAVSERQFIEAQTADARTTLQGAEEVLRRFLERNRSFESSPDLKFEHDRLQREVLLQQTLFSSLSQALQQARLAEVRDTPLITVIDPPLMPAMPVGRRLPLRMFIAVLLGGMLGIGLAFVRRTPASDDFDRFAAYSEVVGELRSALTPVSRAWNTVRGRRSSA